MIVEQYPAVVSGTPHLIGDVTLRTNIPFVVSENLEIVTFFLGDPPEAPSILIEIPLGDAVAYWHPYSHWGRSTLPPDWLGSEFVSLPKSAPIGCLYAHDGRTLLGFALDDGETRKHVRFGVSEESKGFVVCIDLLTTDLPPQMQLKLTSGDPATRSLEELTTWQRGDRELLPVSPVATEPVYSTWYAYHHDVDAETLLQDAPVAVELGFGSLFLDFGWQRHGAGRQFEGCGDWVPDAVKFPDMPQFVRGMRAAGLAVTAWVAPFFLGALSDRYAERVHLAPHHDRTLNTHILDPRYREVREDIVGQLFRLVVENDLDGLKIDFIDTVAVYDGQPSAGDIAEVSVAVRVVLGDLRKALAAAGKEDILIEFRQPYTAVGMMEFANVMRAEDCPGDAVLNRTSIIDARLSGWSVVHSDMMMWHESVTAEQLVRHLHSALLSVPQISVPVRELSDEHAAVMRRWLALWRDLSGTTLNHLGALSLHGNAPVSLSADQDGERAVIVVYEPHQVIDVPDATEVVVINATAEATVHLRLSTSCEVRATDVNGRVGLTGEVKPTASAVTTVEVPESGHLRLTRL